MKQNLINVYNALTKVETKGNSTKIMAQCLTALELMVNDFDKMVATNGDSAPENNDAETVDA